jgi:hypothetical protein
LIDPDGGDGRRGWSEWLSEFFRSDNTGGVFYGWRLVAIGVLIILVGRAIGGGLIGTAWASRAYDDAIALPWSVVVGVVSAITWWVSLWFAGRGVDRLGPRRMAQIGLPLAGLVALFAALPAPGMLEAAVTGMVVLGMMGAYLPAVTVLNHWFRDRLALALALMLVGASAGGFVVKMLMAALLLVADWRLLTVVAGATILVAALPLVRAIRNLPEDRSEHPDGLAPAPTASIPNHTWREAMKSRQFWTLAAAGACVAVASGISTVYDWQIISQGSATFETIDKFGSFEKFASAAGILIGGLASCRFPVRYVLAGSAVAQTVGMALLLSGSGRILLESGLLLGVASGMAAAPGIAAVGIYFGRRSFGMITVTAFLIDWVVSSAGLPSSGYLTYLGVEDGVYTLIFVAAAIVSLIGAGLYLALGQPRLSPSQRWLVSRGAGASD